jgi:N,N-dimethyl phenylurea N-demethylase beta subunit
VSTVNDDWARGVASDFLALEAKLLDERRFDEWLELVDDEVVYEIPVRMAALTYEAETQEGAFRIRDDKNLLRVRVARLNTGQAWAEVAPSRTVRVVGSVLASRGEGATLNVESALLLYRQRGHEGPGDIIPVRRTDVLRVTDTGPKLLSRRALIAEAVLQTSNLGVFL